jgi:hypothetical protein
MRAWPSVRREEVGLDELEGPVEDGADIGDLDVRPVAGVAVEVAADDLLGAQHRAPTSLGRPWTSSAISPAPASRARSVAWSVTISA